MMLMCLVCAALCAAPETSPAPAAPAASVHRAQIAIRDPFVLPVKDEGLYYMYGTNPARGTKSFLCYTSADLETWTGPIPVFTPPEHFWADRQFWAPEVHVWEGRYYLFASYSNTEKQNRGTQIAVADSPRGPFIPLGTAAQTPAGWLCLDGTLFVDGEGKPWMVFCHEWVQVEDGEIQALPLARDLSKADGPPVLLFRASEAPWVRDRKDKVTDGPFLHRTADGTLLMLWSSFGHDGKYKTGLARSLSGKLGGPWRQEPAPVFEADGGHAMIFTGFDGVRRMALHAPNKSPSRPVFLAISESGGSLRVKTN